MRTTDQILELLPQLDQLVADELEDQDLDFKEWNIIVTLLKQDVSGPFRSFVTEQAKQGRLPGVDELLVLQYLLRHTELETTLAAELCQRPEAAMRNTLSRMERDYAWLQRGGSGRGTYWTLNRALAKELIPGGRDHPRIDWEAAKTRVLSILKQRTESGEAGLRNAEIRALTHFDRNQVFRLMRELQEENPRVTVTGHGVGARHVWNL